MKILGNPQIEQRVQGLGMWWGLEFRDWALGFASYECWLLTFFLSCHFVLACSHRCHTHLEGVQRDSTGLPYILRRDSFEKCQQGLGLTSNLFRCQGHVFFRIWVQGSVMKARDESGVVEKSLKRSCWCDGRRGCRETKPCSGHRV